MGIPIVTAPAQAMLMMLAGWLNREQQTVVEYQKEEIRILRELLGKGRLRLTDERRRRLAIKSRGLSHQTLRGARLDRDAGHADAVVPEVRWVEV